MSAHGNFNGIWGMGVLQVDFEVVDEFFCLFTFGGEWEEEMDEAAMEFEETDAEKRVLLRERVIRRVLPMKTEG